jgi:hypothetical protein
VSFSRNSQLISDPVIAIESETASHREVFRSLHFPNKDSNALVGLMNAA